MKFKSLHDLCTDIQLKLLHQLPRDISIVYGIPRSGMIPAAIIATALGAKLGTAGGTLSFGSRHKHKVLPEGGKVLLVDDSIHTGKAMSAANSLLMELDTLVDYRCVVYAHSESLGGVDFYAEVLDGQRIFQWNFTGIKATENYCWDLDGVICTNPTIYDDDGDGYANHILNVVKPLYLPQVKVRAIVTNRIEQWRNTTEGWLRKYGVQYEHLKMQPWSTAVERRANSSAEEFKAWHLRELNGSAFIESDDNQARKIATLSGRPVLSVESMQLFETSK